MGFEVDNVASFFLYALKVWHNCKVMVPRLPSSLLTLPTLFLLTLPEMSERRCEGIDGGRLSLLFLNGWDVREPCDDPGADKHGD